MLDAFSSYFWPGNVRELQNLVERAVIPSDNRVLSNPLPALRTVDTSPVDANPVALTSAQEGTFRDSQRASILKALQAGSLIVGSALGVGIVLGIQNHEDHVLTSQITQTEADLRLIGARIANIKDHDFKTMAEYVGAYAEIEPLLTEYDQTLQEYSELYNTAQRRDQKRGLINIQRLHNRYNPEVWRNTSELITVIREINDVMKREASVIRDMRSIAEQEQVQFWHEEFMPLMAQEHALRERLLIAGQKVSQQRATQ
jgi:hypothetical protein